jgi:hypothetical protein
MVDLVAAIRQRPGRGHWLLARRSIADPAGPDGDDDWSLGRGAAPPKFPRRNGAQDGA